MRGGLARGGWPLRVYVIGKGYQTTEIDPVDAARRFLVWLARTGNPALDGIIQVWLSSRLTPAGSGCSRNRLAMSHTCGLRSRRSGRLHRRNAARVKRGCRRFGGRSGLAARRSRTAPPQKLELPAPFTLAGLRSCLEHYRGRTIRLVPIAMSPGAPSGVWLRSESTDFLFFEEQTSRCFPPGAHCRLLGRAPAPE